jgi:hypothetical protein
MNLETLKEKPIFQMTGEEFLYLQNNVSFEKTTKETLPDKNQKYVYGIRGIAKLFGCSISSANRIKKSGIIDKAIIQNRRKIIVDSELALELIKASK